MTMIGRLRFGKKCVVVTFRMGTYIKFITARNSVYLKVATELVIISTNEGEDGREQG